MSLEGAKVLPQELERPGEQFRMILDLGGKPAVTASKDRLQFPGGKHVLRARVGREKGSPHG